MAEPTSADPVKLFAAVLFADKHALEQTCTLLIEEFGTIDYTSPVFSFEHSDYYTEEMGWPLFRIF